MGTGLKVALPPVKINFPISKAIEGTLKSLSNLLEFYGISSSNAKEIEEKTLEILENPGENGGRVEIDIFPKRERIKIDIAIKKRFEENDLTFSFKSEKIKIIKITRKGERVKINIEVMRDSFKLKQ